MNRSAVFVRDENLMTLEQEALSPEELAELVEFLSDKTNPRGLGLLALAGASSVTGLMARLAAADSPDRDVLLTAIRRLLKNR